MGSRPIDSDTVKKIISEHRTGAYSLGALATKHSVSKAFVHKTVKDIEQDLTPAIEDLSQRMADELSVYDSATVDAMTDAVAERTKHVHFFNQCAMKNVREAVEKLNENTTQAEHRLVAETILKGRETVLGRNPDTAVQVNSSSLSIADAIRLAGRNIPQRIQEMINPQSS